METNLEEIKSNLKYLNSLTVLPVIDDELINAINSTCNRIQTLYSEMKANRYEIYKVDTSTGSRDLKPTGVTFSSEYLANLEIISLYEDDYRDEIKGIYYKTIDTQEEAI